MKIRHFKHSILIGAGLIFAGLSLVLLRGLPTRDTSQSIAIIDWNWFGENSAK